MPPKAKAKNAPNQHDKRHESGLAAPGRRATKQRSNTHLNGQPNGKPPVTPVSPPSLPSTGLNQGLHYPRRDVAVASSSNPDLPTQREHVLATATATSGIEATERGRTSSDVSLEEPVVVSSYGADMADNTLSNDNANVSTPSGAETQPAANKYNQYPSLHTHSSSTSTMQQPGSTLAIVSTILAYYPLRDAISILILLLSLPPTLVLVIQTLFASLTFVPPTAGISLSTLPNIREMFNASNLGYPALATILLVDLIFYLCWLPVWRPVQGIFLDLSHAVIAVSLSGAAASTGGPTYGIVTCSTVVCVVHVLRYRAIHLTALDYLRSVIHKMDVGLDFNIPSAASSFIFSQPSHPHGWLYTTARTLLGIHIVSQGVTTCIRRSLASANERNSNLPAITKTDPEATAGSEPSNTRTAGLNETTQHAPASSSTDGRPPGPPPALRDGKVRESNSKKKRKQANQVRSQQPLWAAIASTKVTFVKEMEQRDAADDAKEAMSMDTSSHNRNAFASSLSTATTDRIWVCEVRDTEMLFSLELSPQAATENADQSEDKTGVSVPGIDKSKPFYVRVNGAAWSSTRITSSVSDEVSGDRYDGEIFGLAPLSNYHCEIVGMGSQQTICSASLITQPAPTAEQAAMAPLPGPPPHQALRPSSPTTTLKQSIQQAEARLLEIRNRSKKSKKDQRAAHSDIKKEINALRGKLENSGGVDDKQARRLQQITQHKNQADEATADLKQQIEALGDIPEDEQAEAEAARRAWRSASDVRSAANRELDNARNAVERDVKDLKADLCAAEAKREKLVSRYHQRKDELEQAVSKQQADMSARQRHEFERAQKREEQEKQEGQLRYHVSIMHSEAETYEQKAMEAYQQGAALQSWATQGPASGSQPFPGYSSPPTPENAGGTNGSLSPQMVNGFATSTFPGAAQHAFSPAFHNAVQPPPVAPRGRSSSMLSQYSGFTEDEDDGGIDDAHDFYPFDGMRQPYPWPMQPSTSAGGAMPVEERKESTGSGSGSGSGSGVSGGSGQGSGGGSSVSDSPRPDAKVFVPSNHSKMSPIGPPSKKVLSPQSPPGVVGGGYR